MGEASASAYSETVAAPAVEPMTAESYKPYSTDMSGR